MKTEDEMNNDHDKHAKTMAKAMLKPKPIIRRKIKQWLAQQPQVISVEMILEYVYSGKLPTVTRDDGWEMSFIFHPEAATEFALLWASLAG
jgi:hypothetical protein